MIKSSPSGVNDHQQLFDLLQQWQQHGWLRALDLALTRLLAELDPTASPLLLLAAALASHQLGRGHVCLDLSAVLADPDFCLALPPEGSGADTSLLPSRILAGLTLPHWLQALQRSALVASNCHGGSPLVQVGDRLYLRRYWDYEQRVARQIQARLAIDRIAPAGMAQALQALFPAAREGTTDWQQVACALAASDRFSLITGGPGTGKTTTVVRLLALLQEAALAQGGALRLSLAAPTGKAAARLTESIGSQVAKLAIPEQVRSHIPTQVTTVHRLLGTVPNSRRFRHHAGNRLPLDVLVVDEASMIDLEMMAQLLDALPPSARLILLGDKDQLASVEAGAVLGDLCRDAEYGDYSAGTVAWLQQQQLGTLHDPKLRPGSGQQALAQHTVMLRQSHRFHADSGIGQLARAVNAGAASEASAILRQRHTDLHHLSCHRPDDSAVEQLLIDGLLDPDKPEAVGYGAYLHLLSLRPSEQADAEAWHQWASSVLTGFNRFQLLAAVRQGPWGVQQLNVGVARALQRRGLLSAESAWYEGRPVMITRNDYALGLMNGDVGMTLRLPAQGESAASSPLSLRVAFPRNDGSGQLRYVLPSRLGAVETVFAMTVHKSQGSEFSHTALILPEPLNPVLTRELIYTGITRARHHFTLIDSRREVFEQAVQRQVQRHSGLRDLIDGAGQVS